ncbi:tyrosyl-tRNA synthetase-like protein [Phaeosphaeriaceae sp. PMI808]|nr:tyrosyl-tRNA synthetase-like protein [Phaeosphaeriaceae sp. PMI808]
MSLLRHISRRHRYVCQSCIRRLYTYPKLDPGPKKWADEEVDKEKRRKAWQTQAGRIRTGSQQSMLSLLEERGFVKDLAGGRQALEHLLTEKRIGAYVGVDPTAPSLHVGHLLPLMVLYWLYIYGYHTVALVGGGTVQVGDPSGRTTARTPQGKTVAKTHTAMLRSQLDTLWTNVKCLGIKHEFPQSTSRVQVTLNNMAWLTKIKAIDIMGNLGSGIRLGTMLARDSVKLRMENGEGMAVSEFMYPLIQAYDYWILYQTRSVQLQIGGSDQHGNICTGIDAVNHLRKLEENAFKQLGYDDPSLAPHGLTTPLLTTPAGEKFGKSAGNAVWLDKDMLSSFDLYQYFLRTPDADVERYLKLFTFLPLPAIALIMSHQRQNESKRLAQHLLAKEVVELAHGAEAAQDAQKAHKNAFTSGSTTISLTYIRDTLQKDSSLPTQAATNAAPNPDAALVEYKKEYLAKLAGPNAVAQTPAQPQSNSSSLPTFPLSLLALNAFPTLIHAAGLASSKSEAHRIIASKGAYVAVPNSGTPEHPGELVWAGIEAGMVADPKHFLVDYQALVLRVGKGRVQVCRVVGEGWWGGMEGGDVVDAMEGEGKDGESKESEGENKDGEGKGL